MIVVGLDPSLTNTGIAVLRDGRPIKLTTTGHGTLNARDYQHRSDRIVTQAHDVMATINHTIHLAVIEGPAYGACNASTHDGSGLWWRFYSALRARGIPIAVVAPTTRAKWATGRGNADKKQVLAAVRATWAPWKAYITGHDIADALTLAEIGARHLDEPLHFTPRRRHIEALTSITWPSIEVEKVDTTQAGATP